ncbi:MAG: hypothetical protein ACYC2P_07415 [Paludibacteraceae bacterium]
MIFKRLSNLLFFCVIYLSSFSEESAGGLLFTSSAEKVDKRTSMIIFADKLQRIEDSFTISFDLSIWDLKQFGHIFRVINDQRKEVEFVFVNFYGIDKMYLDFHSPITHKSVQIPISKETIENKELLHLDMNFNLKEDKASITLGDSVYTCSPVGLENPSLLRFGFGLYGLNLDVPQMLIKNLRIKTAKGKSYYFPLKESAGVFAYEAKGKIKAPVKNPEWIVNKHFYWKLKAAYNINKRAYVTFDETNNRILIINGDTVLCYYPRNNSFRKYPTKAPEGFNLIDAIYNQLTGECYLFNADSTSTSKLVKVTDDLTLNMISPGGNKNFLHHNTFFSSSNDLYQFGGYENHTYSDQISVFNRDKLRWETVNFTGNKIIPRFYSASGDGVRPDEKLIFGGFGNETGKQEHGGHNLYDLYQLNLKNKKIVNLWSLSDIPKLEFIPGNNLVLSKDKTSFYVLCYAHHISKTFGYLYRFDLKNGAYDVVSNSIRITSEDMNSSVNLFYNKRLNEFYVVVREFTDNNKTKVKIYSLLSPSITKAELENFIPNRNHSLKIFLIVFLIVLLTLLYIYFFKLNKSKFKLNKSREKQRKMIADPLSEMKNIAPDRKIRKRSAIYLFGDFTAYDNKGMDISYRFSMKLRDLFSIILLFTNYESNISTDKLTSYLWPDKEKDDAKNIRGVTINRLRNILADIDGISLAHENSHWYFVFDKEFYCDFQEYSSIIAQLKDHKYDGLYNSLMEQFVSIVGNGAFLQNVQDSAIENYKSKEEEKIEILIREYIYHLYGEKNYKKIISIASVYFTIEPLNDEVLDLCLKSYNKLGKKEEAKSFLSNYRKRHIMMTGVEYKK